MPYIGELDLSTTFHLDLIRSKWLSFEQSGQEKHNGVKIGCNSLSLFSISI